jgi:hypothetical protein
MSIVVPYEKQHSSIRNAMRTQLYPLTPEFMAQDWVEGHRRWACYSHWGTRCIVPGCPRHGTHVVHWYSPGDFKKYGDSGLGEHKDLVGYNETGSEFLMTVDHIIPDSYGGPKVWWNLQPMCEKHNNGQKHRMLFTPDRERLLLIAELSNIRVNLLLSEEEMYKHIAAEYKKRRK